MRRQQEIPDFAPGESFPQQIPQREEVPQRLAHLLAFDEQMGAVQPMFDETLASRLHAGAFALRDFVFVMREHQIFTAEVQIDDVVFVRWKGNYLLHLVKQIGEEGILIGNNVGKINGWAAREDVLGVVTGVSD